MLNRVQFHAAVSPHSTWSSLRACLGSVFRVDGDDVPLQVLFKPESVEIALRHACRAVLHPDRRAVCIVQVHAQVAAPFLCHDLRTGQVIRVFNPVDHLLGTDAFVIVVIRQHIRSFRCRCQLSAILPGEAKTGTVVIIQRVSNGIIGNCMPVERCQKISPVSIIVAVCVRTVQR